MPSGLMLHVSTGTLTLLEATPRWVLSLGGLEQGTQEPYRKFTNTATLSIRCAARAATFGHGGCCFSTDVTHGSFCCLHSHCGCCNCQCLQPAGIFANWMCCRNFCLALSCHRMGQCVGPPSCPWWRCQLLTGVVRTCPHAATSGHHTGTMRKRWLLWACRQAADLTECSNEVEGPDPRVGQHWCGYLPRKAEHQPSQPH
jgi:hypothetical protein